MNAGLKKKRDFFSLFFACERYCNVIILNCQAEILRRGLSFLLSENAPKAWYQANNRVKKHRSTFAHAPKALIFLASGVLLCLERMEITGE